ncbi:MAG: DUF2726 domain-containing protein [Oscillospiraceae bacterium]|jgi:hypothetical protein|nr:DUF2726 domain-containing protein [Oscillospiraceae bacterium]
MQDNNPDEKSGAFNSNNSSEGPFLYELKESFITPTEKSFFTVIKKVLPSEYFLQPQVNLASIIYRTDNFKFQNELYRNIDACVFDMTYKPIILIEINDDTHNTSDRKKRDQKVKAICEEAGIPLITFWTSYGINEEYISKRIAAGIDQSKKPVRIAHSKAQKVSSAKTNQSERAESGNTCKSKKEGCYIATAVYGSYDCSQVMVLRRYRDNVLSTYFLGRAFIKAYYLISPWLVAHFADKKWFSGFFRKRLDKIIMNLKAKEISE